LRGARVQPSACTAGSRSSRPALAICTAPRGVAIRGPRSPQDRRPVNHDQIARLFDEDRDPDERVRDDDWHGNRDDENGQAWMELDATDTVGQRREWYRTLVDWRGAA